MVTKIVERDCNTCKHHVQGHAAFVTIPARCRGCLTVNLKHRGSVSLPLWEPLHEEKLPWYRRIVQRLVQRISLSH